MSDVTLITCTGGRPEALDRLCLWITQQTFRRWNWIVVDDVDPPTVHQHNGSISISSDAAYSWSTKTGLLIRPDPLWKPGQSTMRRNLALALEKVQTEFVLILEDDELYLPTYIERMRELLEHADIVGLTPARYYHVGFRRYRVIPSPLHASLCQTGFRRSLIPELLNLLTRQRSDFVDLPLWGAYRGGHSRGGDRVRTMLHKADLVVSIKGMPGRGGIGAGHRSSVEKNGSWTSDPDLAVLTEWVGSERAALYANFKQTS